MRVKKSERKQLKKWADDCRERAGGKCQVCGLAHGTVNKKGNKVYLQSHHLLKNHALRFDDKNSIALCPRCHKYSNEFSAHNNPLAFYLWFTINYPSQFDYLKQYINCNNLIINNKETVNVVTNMVKRVSNKNNETTLKCMSDKITKNDNHAKSVIRLNKQK